MTSVGETLRRERLRRNLDLEAVSRELKISPRMLEAIEAEKFEKLPGGVFAKSFVRQYARFLGLDDEELAGEVQKVFGPPPDDLPKLAEPVRIAEPAIPLSRVRAWEAVGDKRFSWGSPLPALALVVVVVMGCSGVYAWWQRTRHPVLASAAAETTRKTAPPVQAPVQQAAAAQPAPPTSVPEAQQPTADREQKPSQPPSSPAGTQAASASQPAAQREASAVPPATAVPPANAPPPQASLPSNPNAPVRVQLTAAEPVWVLARSDGKYLFSGTLDANQSRTVEANSTVVLRLGNAGGVTITLNGKPIGSVGPKGQVRTVNLTAGGVQVVAPKPDAPSDPLGR